MTERRYYSERVNGPQPAERDSLLAVTSRGLLALIQTKIDSNWFAKQFPDPCPDGNGIAGTDQTAFAATLQALVPDAPWPLLIMGSDSTPVPDEVLFDLIEYAHARIAEPHESRYHPFFRHYELDFDVEEGRSAFRTEVNELLRRGRAMYEFNADGEIRRTGTPDVQSVMARLLPATGDDRLDELLSEARSMYTSHRAAERALALERLWDGFERLKTIDLPAGDKKQSIQALLGHLDPAWRPVIENEMKALTALGNEYEIRHFETRAKALPDSAPDYLFARMGALITELLTASGRLRAPSPEPESDWPWD